MPNLETVFADLRSKRAAWLAESPETHLSTLAILETLWRPGSPWYKRALEISHAPFSDHAVKMALEALRQSLTRENLEQALTRELGNASSSTAQTKTYPLGVVTQILPSNHFMTGVMALLQCLLTRNSVVLKLPKHTSGFETLFLDSLRESSSSQLADHVHLLPSDATTEKELATIKQESDGIVVWGSSSAIGAFPQAECAGKVIYHGPRLGLGIVDKRNVDELSLDGLAWDIALWQQLACSSPRVIFVEDKTPFAYGKEVAVRLGEALEKANHALPASPASFDEKTEILSVREMAEWEGATLSTKPEIETHSVFWSETFPKNIPSGFRSVFVVPFADRENLLSLVQPLRSFLQTATFDMSAENEKVFVDDLVSAGVSQFFRPGSGLVAQMGFPHEGEFPLRRLVKIVSFGDKSPLFGMPK